LAAVSLVAVTNWKVSTSPAATVTEWLVSEHPVPEAAIVHVIEVEEPFL
jgi:hypothetical protein